MSNISKYKIKKEIEIIIHKLFVIKKEFYLRKNLTTGENLEYICRKFPYMFSTIIDSLDNNYQINLIKLLNDDNKYHNNICISDIIRLFNNNSNIFVTKKYCFIPCNGEKKFKKKFELHPDDINTLFKKLKSDIISNQKIIDYLKCRRNKSLAHNDKKFNFDPFRNKFTKKRIQYSEIESLINILMEDMTDIYYSLYGIKYYYNFEEKSELIFLKDILKNFYKSNN